MDVLDPQIVAFRVTLQSDLVFLKLSVLNVLLPILIVERKLF